MTNITPPHSIIGKLEYLKHRISVKHHKVNTNPEKKDYMQFSTLLYFIFR
jgi:hypothetical protein